MHLRDLLAYHDGTLVTDMAHFVFVFASVFLFVYTNTLDGLVNEKGFYDQRNTPRCLFVVKKEFGAGARIRCRYLHSGELAHLQVMQWVLWLRSDNGYSSWQEVRESLPFTMFGPSRFSTHSHHWRAAIKQGSETKRGGVRCNDREQTWYYELWPLSLCLPPSHTVSLPFAITARPITTMCRRLRWPKRRDWKNPLASLISSHEE